MGTSEQITNGLQILKDGKAQVFRVKVLSVDSEARTAKVVDDLGIEYPDVRLKATRSESDEVVMEPRAGSHIHVGIIDNDENELFACQYTEIDRIWVKIGDMTLSIRADGIEINGSGFGGLVKAPVLKTQVDKNTAILQKLQEVFTTWAPIPEDGGSALKSLSSQFTGLPRADLGDIENDNILHG